MKGLFLKDIYMMQKCMKIYLLLMLVFLAVSVKFLIGLCTTAITLILCLPAAILYALSWYLSIILYKKRNTRGLSRYVMIYTDGEGRPSAPIVGKKGGTQVTFLQKRFVARPANT